MGDSDILSYQPGQLVTFYKEIKDGYNQRTDDGYIPVIARVIYPGLCLAPGYPLNMTRVDVGLYYFQLTLPSGAAAVGTYFVDIVSLDPSTLLLVNDSRQIVVTAPYGNYSATPVTGGGSPTPVPPTPPSSGATGAAGGDLTGMYPNPIVDQIQQNPVSPVDPTLNQFLQWNGTAWTPANFPTIPPVLNLSYLFAINMLPQTIPVGGGQIAFGGALDPIGTCTNGPYQVYGDLIVANGIGTFSLQGGHTYRLVGNPGYVSAQVSWQWWDETHNTGIGGIGANIPTALGANVVDYFTVPAGSVYTISFRIIYAPNGVQVGGQTAGGFVSPFIEIESLG